MNSLRHVLCVIALMLSFVSNAKDNVPVLAEDSVRSSSHAKKFVDVKLQLTVGGSSSINNYAEAIPGLSDMQFSPGALFRTGIDVAFNIRNYLALGTGMEFGINNTRCALNLIDANTSSINSAYFKNHFYELCVPVFLELRINLGRRIQCVVDLGTYVSYGLGGKVRASGYTSGQNSLGQPVINHLFYKKDYYDGDISIINSVKRFDWGPRVSAGVLYKGHYSLNWVFQMSAPNIAINYNVMDVKYRHLSLGFEVGYVF